MPLERRKIWVRVTQKLLENPHVRIKLSRIFSLLKRYLISFSQDMFSDNCSWYSVFQIEQKYNFIRLHNILTSASGAVSFTIHNVLKQTTKNKNKKWTNLLIEQTLPFKSVMFSKETSYRQTSVLPWRRNFYFTRNVILTAVFNFVAAVVKTIFFKNKTLLIKLSF